MDVVGELFVLGESFREVTSWKPHRIRRICAGHGKACVFFVDEDKEKIGWLSDNTVKDLPQEGIVDIAFGGDNDAALCRDRSGGTWVIKEGCWIRLEVPWKARSISCGARHFALTTTSGDVFTWGRGFEGQLGHAQKMLDIDFLPKPKLVKALCSDDDVVASVACGHNFTMALTRKGVLWAWGEGRCGELGLGSRQTVARAPARLEQRWKRVACGWAHVLAVDENDRLFAWGFNRFGQLGFSSDADPSVLSPRLVSTFETVTNIAASGNFSAAVDSGSVYAWGHFHDGTSTANPTRIEELAGRRVTEIAACSGSAFFAFSPAVVTRAEPPLIPATGGLVLLRGTGLWNAGEELLRVQFRNADKVHTIAGTFVEPDGVRAELPDCFSNSEKNGIEAFVSMNDGKDWALSDTPPIVLYQAPELKGLSSSFCCFNSGEEIVEITSNLPQVDFKLLRVRFEEADVDVPGWVREDGVICSKIPKLLHCDLPALLSVGVAVNGQDYVYLEEKLTVHEADLLSFSPETCSPSNEPILLRGKSFFPHAQIVVRFSSDLHVAPGTYVDDTTIQVTPPEFDQEARVWRHQVGLSLDGGRTFLDSILPFSIYAPADLMLESMSPLSGPAVGGTRVRLKVPEDYLFDGALVRFKSENEDYVPVEATARAVVDEGHLVFGTPSISMIAAAPPPSPARNDEEGVDEGEAEGAEQTRREEEGEEEERGRVDKTLSVSVELALDGVHFVVLDHVEYQFYESPILDKAERLEEGKVLLTGSHFLFEKTAYVKFGDDTSEVLEVAAKDQNTIILESLPWSSQEDGEENVEQRKVHFQVSFNDGIDYTAPIPLTTGAEEGELRND